MTQTEMLAEWAGVAKRHLQAMIDDIDRGRLLDDTLPKQMDFLFHLMERRSVLASEVLAANGTHRGSGTPLYRQIGGDRHE